jgi:hypothetical protein
MGFFMIEVVSGEHNPVTGIRAAIRDKGFCGVDGSNVSGGLPGAEIGHDRMAGSGG